MAATSYMRLFDRKTQSNTVLESFPREDGVSQIRLSPDGTMFAFLSLARSQTYDVNVRRREGGPIRRIARLDGAGLNWAPDSRTLAMSNQPERGGPVSVEAIHLHEGKRRQVSSPPPSSWGDIDVACSPDGTHLAVIRYAAKADGDIWLLSWDGRVERRLTMLNTWINGLAFSADGKEIVFSPVLAERSGLYRVSIDGKRLARVPTPGAQSPLVPAIGSGVLTFEDTAYSSRVVKGRVEGKRVVDERLFSPMNMAAEYVTYSLDGSKIAWIQRDGIWVSDRTSQPRNVALNPAGKRDLAISADSRHLAAVIQDGKDWRIWIVDSANGNVHRLTGDNAQEGRPVWSLSGKYIYWRSERAGEPRYYRRPWPGGSSESEPVSPPLASQGAPGPDDTLFYYLENDQQSLIYEVAIGSGHKPRALGHIPPMKSGYWCVRGSHIIYGDTRTEGPGTPVFRAPIAGGRPELLFHVPVHPEKIMDLSISTDLSEVLWSWTAEAGSVWVLEGFR
jgi:Tol biopolymer transport system component